MQSQNIQVNLPTSIQNVDAGKAGTVTGGGLSCLAAILVMVAFVLPWASCGAYKVSGMEIASNSGPLGSTGQSSGSFILWLVPLIAVAVVAVALISIASPFVSKSQLPSTASSGCVSLLGLAGIAVACLFFFALQSAKSNPSSFGIGGFIQLEIGYWVTVFGFLLILIGGGLGLGSLLLRRVLKKPIS